MEELIWLYRIDSLAMSNGGGSRQDGCRGIPLPVEAPLVRVAEKGAVGGAKPLKWYFRVTRFLWQSIYKITTEALANQLDFSFLGGYSTGLSIKAGSDTAKWKAIKSMQTFPYVVAITGNPNSESRRGSRWNYGYYRSRPWSQHLG